MAVIKTYVFVDLETTGLPNQENNKTRITELCLVVVKREQILATSHGATPRVQHKLTLCFNPERPISAIASEMSGLNNELLNNQPTFNMDTFTTINTFLNNLPKPICLIAHNGHSFDFPILKNHLLKLGVSLSEDLHYADTIYGFYDNDMEDKKAMHTNTSSTNECGKRSLVGNDDDSGSIKKIKLEENINRYSQPKHNKGRPRVSYALGNIYERIFARKAENAHCAEGDCIILLKCFVAHAQQMVQWVDENNSLFSKIAAMPLVD
ncbi:unnamed protein product [Euphydryas editha]|uniref:Exonuclease domain-containing protein n=1 Tax=Euphydryas editha TaxID=104508 RepID=A0AAU9UJU7_EUPED|nr:unnamed protein product [Euphydryas editha]CAH2097961.1 unnamed protein product [Euphydryas editha]